jgi:hypothetical protein
MIRQMQEDDAETDLYVVTLTSARATPKIAATFAVFLTSPCTLAHVSFTGLAGAWCVVAFSTAEVLLVPERSTASGRTGALTTLSGRHGPTRTTLRGLWAPQKR